MGIPKYGYTQVWVYPSMGIPMCSLSYVAPPATATLFGWRNYSFNCCPSAKTDTWAQTKNKNDTWYLIPLIEIHGGEPKYMVGNPYMVESPHTGWPGQAAGQSWWDQGPLTSIPPFRCPRPSSRSCLYYPLHVPDSESDKCEVRYIVGVLPCWEFVGKR